jgi:hypothetical protein
VNRDNRREFGAVPLVVGILGLLFLLFLAAVVGLGAWLLVGVAIVVAGVVVIAVLAKGRRHPSASAAPAPPARGTDDGVHRVLVIADGSCTSQDFREQVVSAAEGRPTRAFVVAPAVGSRVSLWTGDESAYSGAEEHLEATIQALKAIGVEATGHIGAHDPIQAADDGLREFPADEIVFAVHPDHTANWLERGLVEQARDRYAVPVTELVLQTT